MLLLFFAAALRGIWLKATSTLGSVKYAESVAYQVGELGKESAASIWADGQGRFQGLPVHEENLFYSQKAHWFLYEFRWPERPSEKDFVFFFAESSINQAAFYQIKDGKPEYIGRSGTSVPPTERAMNGRRVSFPFTLPEGGEPRVQFLVYYASTNVIDGAARVSSSPDFAERLAIENLIRGLYYGVFFALTIYNLFLYISTVYTEYLYYILFALVTYATQSGTDGYLDLWFFTPAIPWSEHLIASSTMIGVFGILFTRAFLDVQHNLPRINKAMAVAVVLAGVAVVLHIAGWHRSSIVVRDLALFLGMSLILAASWTRYREGYSPALFFLLAWAFLIVFTSFFMLMLDGLIRRTPFTEFALHIATTGEILLMSLGLGDRIKVMYAEKAEEKRRADLKEARANQLSTLVHLLCHDLVNPLTVLTSVAKRHLTMAARKPESEPALPDWQRMDRACTNQLAIINSVREMEAVIYGKKQVSLVGLELHEVYDNIMFTFRERLQAKNLELVSNFAPGETMAGQRILVDPDSFTHTVLSNLISNAIKFSHPGSKIESHAEVQGERVVLTVRDHGIGMPPTLQADLFEVSKKTTRPGTNGERGTGFGMPLVKAYIERYGGQVRVESQPQESPDHGTVFYLTLNKAA